MCAALERETEAERANVLLGTILENREGLTCKRENREGLTYKRPLWFRL